MTKDSTTGVRAEILQILRDTIKVDATGLAPAVVGHYLFGFEEAADLILSRPSRMAASSEGEVVEALAKFFRDVNRPFWEGAMEIDGQDVQDIGLKHGLLVKTQFDPGVHTDATGVDIEAGDEWFETSPAVKAMLSARPDAGREVEPVKMLIDQDWLSRHVETDPDADVEAASTPPVAVPVSEDVVDKVATAAMVCVTPHLKHMISFNNLWLAVRDALTAALAVPDKGVQGDQGALIRDADAVCRTCRWKGNHAPDCAAKDEPWPMIKVPASTVRGE